MDYKHLPARNSRGQADRPPTCCWWGEMCLHMWLSLWSLTLSGAICNTNRRGTLQLWWRFNNASFRGKKGCRALKVPCHFWGHMVPIENSLLPSRHISVSLWFKPDTKVGLSFFRSPPFSHLLPLLKTLHSRRIWASRNFAAFFSLSCLQPSKRCIEGYFTLNYN